MWWLQTVALSLSFLTDASLLLSDQEEHCQSSTKCPPAGSCVHVSNQTVRDRLHEGGMRACRPLVRPVPTAPCSSIGFHQRTPELAGRPLAPGSLHRWEQVHTELMWQAWKSLETPWWTLSCLYHHPAWPVCQWVSDGQWWSGGMSSEGRKDLHVIASGTLTVSYWDEILRAIIRTYVGLVGPGFLLVQDNAGHFTAEWQITWSKAWWPNGKALVS